MQPKKEQLTPRDKDKEKSDKVKVILRIRPFFASEDPEECITLQQVQTTLSRTIQSR